MTQILYLQYTYHGIEVKVDFQSGNTHVADGFAPQVGLDDTPVTEELDLLISGTNADRLAVVHAIERAFGVARMQLRDDFQVYLVFGLDATVDAYRTTVTNGAVSYDSTLGARWEEAPVNPLKAHLTIVHEPVWEGPEKVATAHAQELVYMNEDGDFHTYADILEGAVEGTEPTPTRLEFAWQYPETLSEIYVHHHASENGAPTNLILEGENGGGTPILAAGYSNGAYVEPAIPANADTALLSWTVWATDLMGFDGAWLRTLLRGKMTETGGPANLDCVVWIRLQDYGGTTIWEGPKTRVGKTKEIWDLGVGKIPPEYRFITGSDRWTLTLMARTAATTYKLLVDCLHILPCTSTVHITPVATWTGANTDWVVTDDGVRNMTYSMEDTLYHRSEYNDWGHVVLQPYMQQRIYLNFRFVSTINRNIQLAVIYRPRKRSI